jgi:anaerobic magnesium-protoporphyrin IX monomethyl ester cyclase
VQKKFKIALVDPLLAEGPLYIPTGLCYLSAYLKRTLAAKVEIRILSSSLRTLDQLFDFDPDLIGFSALTHNFNMVRKIAIEIKKTRKSVPLVLGGQHISMAPWSMPAEFDYAILGEGEEAFLRFVQALRSDSVADKATWPGVQFRENGKLVAVPKLGLIEPLDNIPFPDRDSVTDIESIITLDSYRRFNKSGLRSKSPPRAVVLINANFANRRSCGINFACTLRNILRRK